MKTFTLRLFFLFVLRINICGVGATEEANNHMEHAAVADFLKLVDDSVGNKINSITDLCSSFELSLLSDRKAINASGVFWSKPPNYRVDVIREGKQWFKCIVDEGKVI